MFPQKIEKWIERMEAFFLIVLLLSIIGIGTTQIFLRNSYSICRFLHLPPLAHQGIIWADVAVRHLFFVLGFLGAGIATKEGSHLAMDLVARFLRGKGKAAIEFIICLTSAAISALLVQATYHSVWIEKVSGDTLPNLDKIPTYWAFAVIPVGFGIMSLRFILNSIRHLRILFAKKGAVL